MLNVGKRLLFYVLWMLLGQTFLQCLSSLESGFRRPFEWMFWNMKLNWMNWQWLLRHFVLNAKTTQQENHMWILDGQHSHKTLEAIDFARECTSYPQLCKAAYNRAADTWMVDDGGKKISVWCSRNIRHCIQQNNGSRTTGLWPSMTESFQMKTS